MQFKSFNLKVANMRAEQEFTFYPYAGGEIVHLQSDKRWVELNLKSGEGKVSKQNGHQTSWHLRFHGFHSFQIETMKLEEINNFLIKNNGQDGGVKGIVSFSNENHFSTVS